MSGNLLVGQSGGPTAVINASLAGVIHALGHTEAIDRIIGMRFGIEGFLGEELVDLGALSAPEINLLSNTPSSALGSCRY